VAKENSFIEDVCLLRKYVETIVLESGDAKIAIVPAYQGRTMTSSAQGDGGTSCGWINHKLVADGPNDPQVNLFGGEDRFWVSPEGGQFSVFFDPGAKLDFSSWRTPAVIDREAFDIVAQNNHSVTFKKNGQLKNYRGFEFELEFQRTVDLLSRTEAEKLHGIQLNDLDVVFHESQNKLTNLGSQAWNKETGLLGIWILCMNKPAPDATLIVPFRRGSVAELGSIVTADYFGKLDDSRLRVSDEDGLIYMRGDGELRSKIGLSYSRVQPFLGSWDPTRKLLSIVQFNLPESAPNGYTNNLWEIQDDPFAGDVINGYNDGPNESGGKLGGFFELETISPALALSPHDSYTHVHRTLRIQGHRERISAIAAQVFGASLDKIEGVLSN